MFRLAADGNGLGLRLGICFVSLSSSPNLAVRSPGGVFSFTVEVDEVDELKDFEIARVSLVISRSSIFIRSW